MVVINEAIPIQSDSSGMKKGVKRKKKASDKEDQPVNKEKAAKKKKKEIVEHVKRGRKSDKEKIPIDPNVPTLLRTRMTPVKLYEVVHSLNKEQRKAVRDLGFRSLLGMTTNGIPGKLARYVLNQFNPSQMRINLPAGSIDINPELVHELTGIPIGGHKIYEIKECEEDLPELMYWKEQYDNKPMRPGEIEEIIKNSEDAGPIFKMNFVVLFTSLFCEQHKLGTCKNTFLNNLFGKVPIKDIDWCDHIVNCLKVSKETWDETDRGSYYCGPLLVLMLAYVEFVTNFNKEVTRNEGYAITRWNMKRMSNREKAELRSGNFGNVEIDEHEPQMRIQEESSDDDNDDLTVEVLIKHFYGELEQF